MVGLDGGVVAAVAVMGDIFQRYSAIVPCSTFFKFKTMEEMRMPLSDQHRQEDARLRKKCIV